MGFPSQAANRGRRARRRSIHSPHRGATFWRREGATNGHFARVRALLPPHLHRPIEAEHNLLLTHPDVVVDAVLDWMKRE
jgi:hypothetical protein